MNKESVYLDGNNLFVPKKMLEHIHSQLKLTVSDKLKKNSFDSIGKYLREYFKNGFKEYHTQLFHVFNSTGIGLSAASIERALKGEKGITKTSAKYELLDFICYSVWENSLIQVVFNPEFQWGEKTVYTVTIPVYALEEINELTKTGVISPKSIVNEKSSLEIKTFAKKIYIELTTRKAAIPIDENNDVIEEIYDSWYKLFCIIRDELKILPIECFKDQNNPNSVIYVAMKILNDVLRLHLTEHQAKFRNWIKNERLKPESKNLSPQKLQKKYPDYINLINSLKETNKELIEFSSLLLTYC